MKKVIIAIILLLIALGLRAPAISVMASDTISVLLYSTSPYAVNEDTLAINITENNPNYPGYGNGLSPGTVYRFDDLLIIENNNDFPVCVELESQSDLIEFYTDGMPPLPAISFTLAVNEHMSVGVEFNAAEQLGLMEEYYSIQILEGGCQ